MAIIVQREGERARIVSESRFPNEAELQRYVYENPEVLPISDIKDDAQFTVLDKETPAGTGYIDILGVDSDGELYIIETKLFGNSDKRRVIAQVLDYGAALWSALPFSSNTSEARSRNSLRRLYRSESRIPCSRQA